MARRSSIGPLDVRLVARSERHLPEIAAGLNSGCIAATTFYRLPITLSVLSASLAGSKRRRDDHQYSIIAGRRVVGMASLRPPVFGGLELAIGIFDAAFRGAGVGTFVTQSLCAIAFEELGVGRVELGVYPENLRAIKCYERSGFVREALLRRFMYHDGGWPDLLWMARTSDAP